ncbi:MAG TPA: hypothetical protein VJT49_21045 [Amycolatopsis sp.]|uniref:hypothetical protein n=1 Tax=Amycolatopsis sp. TaxID=37632 RepID=UPI002B4A2F4A|nr:hypothetical protein [Amycolatopsis sp.]HKS47549.1 hypothetical protein [Amycolatopsis sp.]
MAGRYADLVPGSPDLPLVADMVTVLACELAHCPASAQGLAEQWARLAAWRRLAKDTPDDLDGWARDHLDALVEWESRAIELADGKSLGHTDLHPLNILVDGAGAGRGLGLVPQRRARRGPGVPRRPARRRRAHSRRGRRLGGDRAGVAGDLRDGADGVRRGDLGHLGIPGTPPPLAAPCRADGGGAKMGSAASQ